MNDQNKNISKKLELSPNGDANKDPITGEFGSHPIGTGLGAVGVGAAAGALGGAVAGPIGAVAGAVIGAIAGGVAGKSAAEMVNPTDETKYWRDTYASRPYALANERYEDYAPAYRYGWEAYTKPGVHPSTFDSVTADLERGWNQAKGASTLAWDKARHATKDAWERVSQRHGTKA